MKIDLGEFANRIAAAGGRMESAALRGVRAAAFRLEGLTKESIIETKPYPPINTAEMIRSVHTTRTKNGAIVSVDAPHAPFMEWGTRPHFPPLAPLAEWAYQKGFADDDEEAMNVAYAVAVIISRWGLEPRHYMKRAIEELERLDIIKKEILHEMKEAGLLG